MGSKGSTLSTPDLVTGQAGMKRPATNIKAKHGNADMLKALTNNRLLLSELNKGGDLKRIARDLNLYQTIETDNEWECMDGSPMRKKSYLVKHSKGFARWHVKMKRGDVVSVGCVHNVDFNRPFYTA